MARLARRDVELFPLCLGGNVFGWTAGESQSFAVLDAYERSGGNFVDTADAYSAWAPGNSGGESETILGRWMKSRGVRDRMVIATKVGKLPALRGLSERTIEAAADASLRRLMTDRIDLYYAHADDPATPLEETLAAFDGLVRAGKVGAIGASNYAASRLRDALAISRRDGLEPFVAVQDHHNLVHRSTYDGPLADLCARERLLFLPYYGLAQGFLTGKYRTAASGERPDADGPRRDGARKHADARGLRVLAAVDAVAGAHGTTAAAVSLAWLRAQPGVAAPIASARTPEQLAELLPMTRLELTSGELARLTEAGR